MACLRSFIAGLGLCHAARLVRCSRRAEFMWSDSGVRGNEKFQKKNCELNSAVLRFYESGKAYFVRRHAMLLHCILETVLQEIKMERDSYDPPIRWNTVPNFSVSIAAGVHIRLLSSWASWNECYCVRALPAPHCSNPLQTAQSSFCFCTHGPTAIHIPRLSKASDRHMHGSGGIVLCRSRRGTLI